MLGTWQYRLNFRFIRPLLVRENDFLGAFRHGLFDGGENLFDAKHALVGAFAVAFFAFRCQIAQKGHTIAATAAVRFFLFPLNSHLHVVHHLEPATPWFLLPKRSQRYSSWDRINGVFGEGGLLQRLMT